MTVEDRRDRYCVVGAGASGLTAAKNLRQAQIPFDCLEREDDLGGNWLFGKPFSSIYRSTHLISSKTLTEYTDFPMPDDWPPYPGHEQVLEYFRDYARHFGLRERIEFNTTIARTEPAAESSPAGAPNSPSPAPFWDVTLADGRVRRYRGVVIANGHHWDPNWPDYPGHFAGQTLHSSQYKTPDMLVGRRVLVVGAGNSGCDIAVESAQHAARTWHSTRRGYHYVPKFLFGRPADRCGEFLLRLRLPAWLRRLLMRMVVKMAIGSPQDYGLPPPDHRLLETHPIVNSQMLYFVGHGMIGPKPDVARLDGDGVIFADGSRETIDLVIYATGFRISFPFIDPALLNWRGGRPDLFLNAFHPQYDNLFVAGMIQPDSGEWGIVDYQARLMARFIRAQEQNPAAADRFRRLKAGRRPDLSAGIRYIQSPRHLIEVEHFSYRRRLQKLIAEFGDREHAEPE